MYDVVQQVFNGTLDRGYNRTLASDLFMPINANDPESIGLLSLRDITNRILDGQAASDKSQAEKGMRLGYMGHLTLIAEEVCKFGSRHPPETLDQVVLDRVNQPEWIQYVEGPLAETREKDSAVLGGVRPETAIGMRPGLGGTMGGGIASNFTSNTNSTLASVGIGPGMAPQDSSTMTEGTVGQSFEMNSGPMLSEFGDGSDEDEEMGEERESELRRATSGSAFSDDEQVGELSLDDVDMDYR